MRLHLCSPSHLLFLATGLALGVLFTIICDLFISCNERERQFNTVLLKHDDDSQVEKCVCGHEMKRLERLAQIALYQNQVSTISNEPTAPPDDVSALNQFLNPPQGDTILTYSQLKRKSYRTGSKEQPMLLNEEYITKKELFVGVLTQQAYLHTRAISVYETWGKEIDQLVFFVGEDCNISANISHLPIVKLKGVPDAVYPPLRKSFAVMDYMYKHYINKFNWFIRADDDMYVRTTKLKDLLRKLHPHESVYLGRAGTGRLEDLKRLKLLSHERYCMGGPGIILSVGALRLIGPHFNNCLTAVLYHDRLSEDDDWNDDDVEIGRCLSRKTNIHCSSSMESRKYFVFDYHGDILRPLSLWTKPHFRELITVHPIKDANNMRSVHHFFTMLEFKSKYEELSGLVDYLNELCETLAPHVAPPRSASIGCDLKLHPHLAYFNSSSSFNHVGVTPGNYIIQETQVPFVYNPRDKFDLSPWIRFNDSLVQEMTGLSPQHAPYTSFRSEITHLMNQVAPYITSQYTSGTDVKIIDGYTRFNPHLGREYLLSLRIAVEGRRHIVEYKQFHFIRELGSRLSVIEKPLSLLKHPRLYVILPVENTDDQLKAFLISYVHTISQYSKNEVHLIAVVFNDEHANTIEEHLNKINSKTSATLSLTIAISTGEYDRLKAIEIGMNSLDNETSLAFITDVDTRFGKEFIARCHSNTVLNERVYFPISFWLYGSQYRKQSTFADDNLLPVISRWTGQWGGYDFGLVCIYKEDYDIIGGYHDSKYVVELFERVSDSHLEVMQAPDPGLYHLWSVRTCREMKLNSQREICQRLKQFGLVDQPALSKYLAELSNFHNPLLFEEDEQN